MPTADYILSGFRDMTQSDVQGGTALYRNATLDCTAGVFTLENPLVAAGGGHSPRLLGVIEIAAEDFPPGVTLKTGQPIDVTSMGTLRHCKVESWKMLGPLVQLVVVDLHQNA